MAQLNNNIYTGEELNIIPISANLNGSVWFIFAIVNWPDFGQMRPEWPDYMEFNKGFDSFCIQGYYN